MKELKIKLENLIVELCATNRQLWEMQSAKIDFVSGDGLLPRNYLRDEIHLRDHRAKLINEINLAFNKMLGLPGIDWHDVSEIPTFAYEIIQRTANISVGKFKELPKADRVDGYRGLGQTIDEGVVNALKYSVATLPVHKDYLKFLTRLSEFLLSCIVRKCYKEKMAPCLTVINFQL
jgi:hypothetical protein